ncbi:MAG: LysM peptidoglycan-binding domain-containing protein [Thermomicrobiales bacterium]
MNRKRRSRLVALAISACAAALMAPLPAAAAWHTVQPGETLWMIGQEYGVDTADIIEANDISNPNLIAAGADLWIPGGDEAPSTGGTAVIHIVSSGDTLASIAAEYGVDTSLLASLNGLESPYIIFPGQEITIPYAELPINPTPPVNETPGTIDYDVPFYDRETVRQTVISLSEAYGWDPYLILSLAWTESTWDQRAISNAGAVGVMQLMPATADWAGPSLVGRQTDYVNSAWDNVETGIAYLTNLRSLTGSDYLALASYFQGLASVERDGIFPSTREYALGIIQSRDLFASGSLP